MLLFDIVWNLFRKSLGNTVYKQLIKSPLGRPYEYYSITTYRRIFDFYRSSGYDFKSRRILEVGCGEQFYTSCFFLADEAETVTLVDPILNEKSASVKLTHIGEAQDNCGNISDAAGSNIRWFGSLDAIPSGSDERFDFICSHFVLEHFDNLERYFSSLQRLLSRGGISYNFVDLSNHAYHLFDSRWWTRWLYRKMILYHLGYSDTLYTAITDRRIWVNRLLLPAYRALAEKYRLEILKIATHPYRKVKIHLDVLTRNRTSHPDDLYVTHFSLLMKKN